MSFFVGLAVGLGLAFLILGVLAVAAAASTRGAPDVCGYCQAAMRPEEGAEARGGAS